MTFVEELTAALPKVDPENGDILELLVDKARALAVFSPLIEPYKAKFIAYDWYSDDPSYAFTAAEDVAAGRRKVIATWETDPMHYIDDWCKGDYVVVVRHRGGGAITAAVLRRTDPQTAQWVIVSGAYSSSTTNRTFRRAMWDVGIRRLTAQINPNSAAGRRTLRHEFRTVVVEGSGSHQVELLITERP